TEVQAEGLAMLAHFGDAGLVRFPDSAIGPGARWTLDLHDVPELMLPLHAELALVSLEGDRARVQGTFSGHGVVTGGIEADIAGTVDAAIDLGTLQGTTSYRVEMKHGEVADTGDVTITVQ